jgi:hypothetical protein
VSLSSRPAQRPRRRHGPSHRRALEAIFSGQAGGPFGRVSTIVTERLPTRAVAIEFGNERRRRWARIGGGVLDCELEGVEGRQPGTESWIDNVKHPVSPRLAAARATRGAYHDHGWTWDNTGRNGHYSRFEWTGWS